jgi:membrane-associated phospholipid phosphatase
MPKDNAPAAQQSSSQQPPQPAPQGEKERPEASASPKGFLRNIARDQKDIWTSPAKVRVNDINWLAPMAGLTAGLINADEEFSSRLSNTGTLFKRSSTASNAGVAAMLAGTGSLYFLGRIRGDDRQRETGILAAEAAVNSMVVVEVLKLASRRERPQDGTGQGRFFKNGSLLNSSFPSAHAVLAWSAASVLAHEYPGVLTQTLAYGLATGVSVARVTGKQHFTSDVVVGSSLGWLIGRQAYAAHHQADLPGGGYGTFYRDAATEGEPLAHRSSPYVAMDSWVYPAMDRLAALGAIDSAFAGLRPWTRDECARLLEEAEGEIDEQSGDEGSRLYAALAKEFARELNGTVTNYAALDSVYARATGVSGTPLTDGYHFGQTIVNDYGRPYQHGFNGLAGFSASGSSGAMGFYVRGEYEHAPSAPGVSQAVQDQIQITDFKPVIQPAGPIAAFSQPRLLDSYVMLNIKGWQTSFGKQTLWTAPTQDPFLQTNNAEPMYMLRVSQTSPKQLPGFLKYLGPFRTEFWVGKMTGHHFITTQDATLGIASSLGRTLARQPMVNGNKINFKPTPNFEFGVGRTGVFGGPDFPITAGSMRHAVLSTTNAVGRGHDPGDRRSTFDFSYRLPGFRKWLTLYEDSFVEDEISPIGYPRRAAHTPGLYMSQVPGLPHLDLRAEASFTNLPGLIQTATGGFFYWNVRYLDGYTNKGNIIGNGTVGRQGISVRGSGTYWFASDKTVQLGYRSNIADSMFLQGGNLRDIYLKSEWSFHQNVSVSAFLQHEWWNFPLLTAGQKQNDFTAQFQVTYWPHWRFHRGD